jgi:HK97 family phage major capsid protein
MPRGRRPNTFTLTRTGDSPALPALGDLPGMDAGGLGAALAAVELRIAELHQDERGVPRELDDDERAEFDELLSLRSRIDQHARIREQLDRHPGSVQRAYVGGEREWSARRDDPDHVPLLGPGDSFVDYLRDRGQQVHSEEYRVAVLGALGSGNGRALTRLAHFLPDSETRDMLISTGAGTAALTPDFVAAEVVDQLRKAAVVQQLGARLAPMASDTLKVPRLTGDPTVSWLAEGATVTATDATLDVITLTARRLTGLTKVSQELVEDSDPVTVGEVLRLSFGQALGTEMDRVALKGSGTPPEPQGIRNASGVSVNATAAVAAWAQVNERVGVLIAANVPLARIGAAINAASFTTIMGQADTAGQFVGRPPFLADMTILPTTSLTGPATGELYAGDYSELIIGVRIALDFQVLRERYADEGKVGFLPRVRADVAVRHGASFAVRTALST